jgi:hypothetical protein
MVRPEGAPEPMPEITPEMIRIALKALESKGMVKYTEGGAYVPTEGGWKLLSEIKSVKEEIIAYGHPSINATNLKAIFITKAGEAKENGVIAVKANKSPKDFKKEIKDALKEARKVEVTIEAEGVKEKIVGYGSPALKLSSSEEIAIRKDDFIDGKTAVILAGKAANELNQELIEKLRKENTKVKITLEVK